MDAGYKQLISYKLADIAFVLGWEFVPTYYSKYEDNRQRDQIKQALRSHKHPSSRTFGSLRGSPVQSFALVLGQNIEALEDFEDILKLEKLPRWDKNDPRLKKLRQLFEGYPNPSTPPSPSIFILEKELEEKRKLEEREVLEGIDNYLIDLLVRSGYFLDKTIRAVEEKHETQGGYSENLLKKRLEYKRRNNK